MQLGEANNMKFRSGRMILDAVGRFGVCMLGVASAFGQAAPIQKPLMADDVFKNIQVLKGHCERIPGYDGSLFRCHGASGDGGCGHRCSEIQQPGVR